MQFLQINTGIRFTLDVGQLLCFGCIFFLDVVYLSNPLSSFAGECKRTKKGGAYRGTKNTTKSGLTCQRWDAQFPHIHIVNSPRNKPAAGLENNFCRNPDNEAAPWCYTMSIYKRWEFCDIPMCEKDKGM